MRTLLVIFASASGYLIMLQIVGSKLAFVGLISGFVIAASALMFEDRVKKTPLRIVLGGAFGLITGLIVANLLTYPVTSLLGEDSFALELALYLFANCIIGYLGLSIGMKKGDEFDYSEFIHSLHHPPKDPKDTAEEKTKECPGLLVDTSVIIDGRIAELCDTGFLDGKLIVPNFVLQELQYIADSPDPIKRARGKRGLDILKQIQSNSRMEVVISDRDFAEIKEVDAKLVAFGKEMAAKVLTNDANLNKIAELHGVHVLNINRLATALKPVVLPGEVMSILVLKEGKEHGQGVGYLEDGTMVVIDNAREFLGKSVEVSITSVLQTSGGRMIFSKVKEDFKRAVYQ